MTGTLRKNMRVDLAGKATTLAETMKSSHAFNRQSSMSSDGTLRVSPIDASLALEDFILIKADEILPWRGPRRKMQMPSAHRRGCDFGETRERRSYRCEKSMEGKWRIVVGDWCSAHARPTCVHAHSSTLTV